MRYLKYVLTVAVATSQLRSGYLNFNLFSCSYRPTSHVEVNNGEINITPEASATGIITNQPQRRCTLSELLRGTRRPVPNYTDIRRRAIIHTYSVPQIVESIGSPRIDKSTVSRALQHMSLASALRIYPTAPIDESKPLSNTGSAATVISKVLSRIKGPKIIAYGFLGGSRCLEDDIFRSKPRIQRILLHCYQKNPVTAINAIAKMDSLNSQIKILLKEHNTKQRPPNPIIRGDFVFQLNMSEEESLISFVENRGAPMSYIFNQICNELLQDLTKFGLRYERYTDLMRAETQQVRVACLPDLQPQAIEMFEIMPLDNTKEYGLTLDRRTGQLEIRVPITSIAAPSAS